MELTCPQCKSHASKRNGFTRHGKQNYRCLDCGRQYSLEPEVDLESQSKHKMEREILINVGE